MWFTPGAYADQAAAMAAPNPHRDDLLNHDDAATVAAAVAQPGVTSTSDRAVPAQRRAACGITPAEPVG
jgi:hypothetical protein